MMPYYDVEVDETRHYRVRYRIEADSPKQAVQMAEEGCSTHGETDISCEGVLNRGVGLSDVTPVPVFVSVEYDLEYYGGDYSGLGEEALLPTEGLTDENLKERFREQTGHDPVHIIHYTFDEPVDANGESL
jgi:hypothetical protein